MVTNETQMAIEKVKDLVRRNESDLRLKKNLLVKFERELAEKQKRVDDAKGEVEKLETDMLNHQKELQTLSQQ